MTLEEFYLKCDNIEPDEYDCHIYPTGSIRYSVRVTINHKGGLRVNRLALERKLGRSIKPGYFACHHCDTASCVNPEHLYEGTNQENQKDVALRYPEVWGHQDPNSLNQLKLKIWRNSSKNKENLKKMAETRWRK